MDALILLAKATRGRRSRQSVVAGLILLAVFLVLGVLLLWWIWPGPPPPPLALAVFDQLASPNQPVQLYAQLGPAEATAQEIKLAGYPIFFEEATSGLHVKATSARTGVATCTDTFPLTKGPIELLAGFPGNRRQRGVQARGRVFVWPTETAFLVVDADHALAATDPETFGTVNNLDIRSLPDAASTLRSLAAKYALVYVTGHARRPQLYGKLRAWLASGFEPAQQFPEGPLLTGCVDGETDAAAARVAVLTMVRSRLTAPGIGIAGDAETAAQYRLQGWEAYLVGAADNVPQGVTPVKDWAALAKVLPH
jgi:hypothetical protein